MSKFVLFLLLAAVNTGLRAASPTSADIPVHISSMNKSIIVDKANWKSPKIEVSILKEDGTELIHENINASKIYNLKNLPAGNYTLKLEDDQQVRVQSLQIAADLLYSKDISTVYKPHLNIGKDHIDMNLMTQGKIADVAIRNTDSKTVFSEKITNEVSATRRYNLKSLPEGEYTIEVKIADQFFIKSFVK